MSMEISRREFIHILGLAGAAGLLPATLRAREGLSGLYESAPFGTLRLMHMTDCHAQLNPIYFREPHVNLGLGDAFGKPPHLVGRALLAHFGLPPGGWEAYALTHLDFDRAVETYGKVGGFAHLATLVKQLRAEVGEGRSLLLDGGDTWQGSATALWTRGQDMLGACNLLGVDVMTGHWEFTYTDAEVIDRVLAFKGDFVAQNVRVKEESSFDYPFEDFVHYDEARGYAFKPYTIRAMGGVRVAVVGQAFPYTPIANPARFIPHWTFGIRPDEMQALIDQLRAQERVDLVVVLSHNGMDVDLKLASLISGVDVIFGGHTHDGVPAAIEVANPGGKTLVTNAGSNGKFLGVMDLDVADGKLRGHRYRLLPVFSRLIPADEAMAAYIEEVRAPYLTRLHQPLAETEETLYRRGNFNGTFDQVIVDALRQVEDTQIAFSPGFRWGTTVPAGQTVTLEHVMDQTAITYPATYRREVSGAEIKEILEEVAHSLFHPDPFRQQGGDMVRVGGLRYAFEPGADLGQRISDLRLADGRLIEAEKHYTLSGWATVGEPGSGRPIWEVVTDYLADNKVIRAAPLENPRLIGVDNNPGLAEVAQTRE